MFRPVRKGVPGAGPHSRFRQTTRLGAVGFSEAVQGSRRSGLGPCGLALEAWASAVRGFEAILLPAVAGSPRRKPESAHESGSTPLKTAVAPPWRDGPVELFVDATGLGIVGQGEWAAARWGHRGRRGWKKLYIAVDGSGYIHAAEAKDSSVAVSAVFSGLLCDVRAAIERITADGGCDHRCVYAAAGARRARMVIPPRRGAVRTGDTELAERDAHVDRIQKLEQHRQVRAENTVYRNKRTLGSRLRSRHEDTQRAEAPIGCRIPNRMTELGMPESYPVGP